MSKSTAILATAITDSDTWGRAALGTLACLTVISVLAFAGIVAGAASAAVVGWCVGTLACCIPVVVIMSVAWQVCEVRNDELAVVAWQARRDRRRRIR